MKPLLLFAALLLASRNSILCQDVDPQVPNANYNIDPNILKFLGVNDNIIDIVRVMQSVLQYFDFTAANVSTECSTAMNILYSSVQEVFTSPNSTSSWALQMLDASGKLPSGLLEGGVIIFGSFDQCLQISAHDPSWAGTYNFTKTMKGQYCSVGPVMTPKKLPDNSTQTAHSLPMGGGGSFGPMAELAAAALRIDVCLPTVCSVEDINEGLAHHIKTASLGFSLAVTSCQMVTPITLTGAQIAATVIFSILGLFLLLGTTLDIGLQLLNHFVKDGILEAYSSRKDVSILVSFSLYKNGLKLLDTRTSSDSLSAINGIRFLSMSWVILGHCYAFVSFAVIGNFTKVIDLMQSFPLQAVFNAYLSVDSFFFLSGCLLTYLTIKELRKGRRLNLQFFGMFYFHRFWRLTPAVFFTIMLVFFLPLMGSGPSYIQSTSYQYYSCVENWWINLLYVQNLVKSDKTCLGHSWYLANDMQFYVISPIILVSLYLNRFVGLAVNTAFLLMSLITTGVLTDIYNFPPAMLISNAMGLLDFQKMVYIKPWTRMAPFCIGIYLGYFLAFKRNYKIPRLVLILGWCLAITCNVAVLYGLYPWNKGTPPSRGVGNLYASVHRAAWAVGLAWMTFACATGHGGIVNRILSWKPFGPLGRMSYMAYLFHPYIQYIYTGMMRERVIYTHYLYVVMFLGFMAVSYGAAFVGSLAFEAPFLALEKILFRKPSDQKRASVTFKVNAETDPEPINGTSEVHEHDNAALDTQKLTEP